MREITGTKVHMVASFANIKFALVRRGRSHMKQSGASDFIKRLGALVCEQFD